MIFTLQVITLPMFLELSQYLYIIFSIIIILGKVIYILYNLKYDDL